MFLLSVQFLLSPGPPEPDSVSSCHRYEGWQMLELAFPLLTRQVFPLDFFPGSIRTSLTTFPRLGTPKHSPDFGAFALQPWAGLGSWPDFRDGNLDVVCQGKCPGHSTALQVMPSSSCVTPRLALSPGGGFTGEVPAAGTKALLEMHVGLTQVLHGLVGGVWCLPALHTSLRCGWGCIQSGAGGKEDHRNTKILQEMG